MSADSLSRGARGASITVGGQLATMVIQFVSTIVLSRLLSPTDFGLIAMVMVFVGIGELLRDFGMPTAALQAKQLSKHQASNVFWVTVLLSLTAGIILVALTPVIVSVYDEPRLAEIVPVMAGVLLVNGLQAQYQVHLARSMRFFALASTTVVSRLLGFGVGVAGALLGWNYWALVAQFAASALIALALSGAFTRWLPSLPRRGVGSWQMLRSGGNFGAAQVLSFAADNADTLMIGAVWGTAPVGQYNRAFQLFMTPVGAIFTPLMKVVVPTINRAVSEGRRAADLLVRVQTSLCGVTVWLLLVTAATAEWLIPLMLGDQWNQAVSLVQILAIGGAFRALSQVNYWAYVIYDQSRQLLYSNLVTKPIQIALMVGGAFISVEAVAWAFAIGRVVTWPINVVWLSRTADQPVGRFLYNGLRIIAAAAISFGATRLLLHSLHIESSFLIILTGAAVATVCYLAVIALSPGGIKEINGSVKVARAMLMRKR